ncbi:MAG TPA: phosphoadenylyl-sulfate reductase, partial [Micromonosporaceae bacterium]|nr:phosphoadenylyl-sulfate reductase [Micromonosporaceae bacterium]
MTQAVERRLAPLELRDLALRAGRDLEAASAEQILEWAIQTFGERFCVTSSFADAV